MRVIIDSFEIYTMNSLMKKDLVGVRSGENQEKIREKGLCPTQEGDRSSGRTIRPDIKGCIRRRREQLKLELELG